jgi:hypothetical protein
MEGTLDAKKNHFWQPIASGTYPHDTKQENSFAIGNEEEKTEKEETWHMPTQEKKVEVTTLQAEA